MVQVQISLKFEAFVCKNRPAMDYLTYNIFIYEAQRVSIGSVRLSNIFGDFLKTITFPVKTAVDTFWATFGPPPDLPLLWGPLTEVFTFQ